MLMLERAQWGQLFFVVNNILAKKDLRQTVTISLLVCNLYCNKKHKQLEVKQNG
jgi:hypothetical protein